MKRSAPTLSRKPGAARGLPTCGHLSAMLAWAVLSAGCTFVNGPVPARIDDPDLLNRPAQANWRQWPDEQHQMPSPDTPATGNQGDQVARNEANPSPDTEPDPPDPFADPFADGSPQAGDQPLTTEQLEQMLAVMDKRQDASGRSYEQEVAGWRVVARPGEVPRGDGPYRWAHERLDEILARPPANRVDLSPARTSKMPLVAGCAVIGLARQDPAGHRRALLELIRHPSQNLVVRQAAIDTLARGLSGESPEPLLSLLSQYGQPHAPPPAIYVPELHAELLFGLARHAPADEQAAFAEALASPAPAVRLAALEIWTAAAPPSGEVPDSRPVPTLPNTVLALTEDDVPQVRSAALHAVAAYRHPAADQLLARAAHDSDLTTRITAIELLGQVGNENARQTLRDLLAEGTEKIRAAAVAALAVAGDDDGALSAAGDKSWLVRRNLAEQLPLISPSARQAVSYRLLDDVSSEVRLKVVEAATAFPVEEAVPLWLATLDINDYRARKAAGEHLAANWPAAERLRQPMSQPDWTAAVGQLRDQWLAEHPGAGLAGHPPGSPTDDGKWENPASTTFTGTAAELDHIERALADWLASPDAARHQLAGEELRRYGSQLETALSELTSERGMPPDPAVYRDLLPQANPLWQQIERLADADPTTRRRAAALVAEAARSRPLSPLAVRRLEHFAARESDELVWESLLAAVENLDLAETEPLVIAGLSQPSAEVRRRACVYLGEHGQMRHGAVLRPLLSDSSSGVVRAAVAAIEKTGGDEALTGVESLLGSSDKTLRIDAARTLARWGKARGAAALERLALDSDPAIRRDTAQAMGQLGQSVYAPALVRLLDDQTDVRRAALLALPEVTGRSNRGMTGNPPAIDESLPVEAQIRQWKDWLAREQGERRG